MDNKIIRVGVIGLGVGLWHIECLQNIPCVKIVAIANKTNDYIESLKINMKDYSDKLGAKFYFKGEELLEKENLDGVHICVQPRFRMKLLELADKKNIMVLLEKPLGSSLYQALALTNINKKYNMNIMMEYPLRFQPPIVELRKLISQDIIGKPIGITADVQMQWIPNSASWVWEDDGGNGLVNENGGHIIDTVCAIAGDAIEVKSFATEFGGHRNKKTMAKILIRHRNSCISTITCGGLASKGFEENMHLSIITEKGEAVISGSRFQFDTLKWCLRNGDEINKYVVKRVSIRQKIKYCVEAFIDCIINKKVSECKIDDGLKVQKILEVVNNEIRS